MGPGNWFRRRGKPKKRVRNERYRTRRIFTMADVSRMHHTNVVKSLDQVDWEKMR